MLTPTCRQMQLLPLCYRLLQGQESQNILHFFLSKCIRLAGPVPRVNTYIPVSFLHSDPDCLFSLHTRAVKISNSFISVFVSRCVKEPRDQFVSLGWLDIMSHEPFFLLSSPLTYIYYTLFPCIETLWTRLLKFSLSQISPEIENVITKQARGRTRGKNGQKNIFTLLMIYASDRAIL